MAGAKSGYGAAKSHGIFGRVSGGMLRSWRFSRTISLNRFGANSGVRKFYTQIAGIKNSGSMAAVDEKATVKFSDNQVLRRANPNPSRPIPNRVNAPGSGTDVGRSSTEPVRFRIMEYVFRLDSAPTSASDRFNV